MTKNLKNLITFFAEERKRNPELDKILTHIYMGEMAKNSLLYKQRYAEVPKLIDRQKERQEMVKNIVLASRDKSYLSDYLDEVWKMPLEQIFGLG